ncbi:hypothetical protein M9458_055542, partial [Cirrhinus mrigala]
MATLRSRLSFARWLPSSSSRGSSSSRKGFTAATARRLGDLQVTVQNVPPGKTPRASAPPRGPVVMPKQTAPPSKSGPSVSFGAPPEEEMSISASEGEQSAGEAGASAEQCPSAVAVPSEADAELSAMLLRAAEGIGLEVPKVDDWFLGTRSAAPPRLPPVPFFPEVHDELVRAWRAPYSARSRPTSSALATLDGGAARGYEGVPQVERDVHARGPGTPPLAEPGADGRWLPSPRPASSATLSRTLPSSSRQSRSRPRRLNTSCPGVRLPGHPRVPSLSLLVAEGAPLRPPRSKHNLLRLRLRPMMRASPPDVVAAAGERRRPLLRGQQPRPAPLRGAPDTGSPEMVEAALWGTRTSVPPPPGEGQDLLCVQPPSTYGSAVPTHSQKEQFFTSLGQVPRDLFLSDRMLPRVRTRSQHSPAREPGKKVSAAQRGQTALQDVHPSGTSPLPLPLPAGCPTAVTSVNAPLIPLAARLAAWLELPSPSRWLIRTPLLHRAQEERWVTTNPGSSSVESVPSQAAVQNAHFETHPLVRSTPGLVCSHRPEGRLLSRLDFASTQTLSTVCFEGRAYQYKVLPFGLSLSPRVFTKVAEGALNPLWRKGIRILNYLDDWLIMAHSRDLLCEHRDLVLQHLSHLGLRVNREKSKLSPVQRISFLGMELDSVNMTACLTNERTQSVLSCLRSFRHKTAVPLKSFQRLLGHMAAAAAVTPLGLLHMRPLQRWLHDRVPRWAWHRGTLRIGVSPQCRRLFSPWSDPAFLRAGVPLGQVSRHVVVYTDASTTGCGAVCNGQAASGSWTGPRLLWHINCLELLAVLLALRRFLPMLRHKHVLVRTDNTATVAYINRQGGLRSHRMSQLARHLLLWSQKRLKSLRAVHIPGELNRAADQLSRQPTHPGEWRLHPQTVQLIWSRFGEAQIDLFASPESSHCQLYYSLSEAPLGRDALAHSWPPGPKYAFPPVSLLAQTLCKIREDGEQVLLVAPYWPTRTCPSLEDSLEEGPSFSGDGHNLAPASRSMEPTRVASGRDTAVIETITQQAYALRWGLFVDWCASRGEDPQKCPIAVVLSFLQEKLERRLSPSTLKVYVAAIAAYHDAVDGASIGKHQLVVRFLRGARRVNPPRPHLVPSWDLSVALRGLRGPPFEPLVSVELKFLSLKTALLTALASIKRVGDLQAFSVNEACLEFGPADSHVVLRPRPGYVPKVPTTPFRDQVVNLQALPPEEADPALALLCPVRALRVYVDRTRSFRRSEQLFVCFGGQQKGNAVSKQRLAHWVVDAISLAYESQGEPCPLEVRAHSTRSVASSYALAHGASLADICRAAGWATPNTFARFYNLRVEPVSSRVL